MQRVLETVCVCVSAFFATWLPGGVFAEAPPAAAQAGGGGAAVDAVGARDTGPPPMWPVGEMRAMLEMPAETAAARAETARLVRELGAGDFATREKASRELAARGAGAFPGLREAVAASGDPEVMTRTASLFSPGKFQVPPKVPAGTVVLVQEYEKSRARYMETRARAARDFDYLLLAGMYRLRGEQGELFFRIVLPQETDPQARAILDKEIAKRASIRARMAIAEGKLDEAERILREGKGVEGAWEDYAVLRALREGAAFDPEKELAKLGEEGSSRSLLGTLLFRAKGDFGRAADFAVDTVDGYRTPGRRALIEAGRYRELASYVESVPKRQVYDLDYIMGYLAAGDAKRANDALDAAIAKDGTAGLRGNVSRILVRFDRAEEAIAQSQKERDWSRDPFHLLCAQLRIREALASIEDRKSADGQIPDRLSRMGLPGAARRLLKDMQPNEPKAGDFPRLSYFWYADQLALAGQPKEAAEWRERGFVLAEPLANEYFAREEQLQKALAERREMDPKAESPASQKLERVISDLRSQLSDYRSVVQSVSFYGDPTTRDIDSEREASAWFQDMRRDSNDLRARYEKVPRIFRGTLSDEEMDKLVDDVVRAAYPGGDRGTALHELGMATTRFHLTGHDKWAIELVQRFVAAGGDPVCWALAGDVALENKDPKSAASYYQRAAVVDLTDGSLMYRLGLALARQIETKAAGEKLMAYAPLLVLADYDQAKAMASAMRRFQGEAVGDKWFEEFTRRYSRVDLQYMGDNWVIARDAAEARGDFPTALDIQKKMLFSPAFPKNGYYSVEVRYMSNVADYHRLRALDAWARKDFAVVVDGLWREMDNGPPDVELLEKLIPALKAADGLGAEKVLGRAMERLKAVVEDYPEAERYRRELGRVEALRK